MTSTERAEYRTGVWATIVILLVVLALLAGCEARPQECPECPKPAVIRMDEVCQKFYELYTEQKQAELEKQYQYRQRELEKQYQDKLSELSIWQKGYEAGLEKKR